MPTIAINGSRLDGVRLPMEPFGNGTVSYLGYPASQIRFSREGDRLSLVVPSYLALALYRNGIVPQDANVPVEVSIGGRPAGSFVVSDLRCPHYRNGAFETVTFTLTRVRNRTTHDADAPLRKRTAGRKPATYVTDITHFLDETGELMQMPGPARKMAAFLTLLIEAATSASPGGEHNSAIRCRVKGCRGTIRTVLPPGGEEISWHCAECGQNGSIRNWQNTKWNQSKVSEPRHNRS